MLAPGEATCQGVMRRTDASDSGWVLNTHEDEGVQGRPLSAGSVVDRALTRHDEPASLNTQEGSRGLNVEVRSENDHGRVTEILRGGKLHMPSPYTDRRASVLGASSVPQDPCVMAHEGEGPRGPGVTDTIDLTDDAQETRHRGEQRWVTIPLRRDRGATATVLGPPCVRVGKGVCVPLTPTDIAARQMTAGARTDGNPFNPLLDMI